MPTTPARRMAEGLAILLQAFADLEDDVEKRGVSSEEDLAVEIIGEVLSAIETVMEDEEYTAGYVASLLRALTEALEEIDSDVFRSPEPA